MRICFLSWRDGLHPEAGGSEVFLEQVAERLVRGGHDVTIVTSSAVDPGLRASTGVHRVRRGSRLTVFPWSLWHVLTRGRRYDVVVEVMNGLSFGTRLVRRSGTVILFHHSHQRQWQMIYPDWRGRVGRWLEAAWVSRVNRRSTWITVSHSSRADLLRWGVHPDHVRVITNAVDHVEPGTAPTVAGRLVCTARLVPHKRVEHAIEAVARLAPTHPDVHLEIIGTGYWADTLRQRVEELGVGDRVTFHGHLTDEERDALVATAALNLLPSSREGWGLVISEAARMSVPTIAYRQAGGVAEAITDQLTGRLVESFDEFVDAIDAGLRHPERTAAWGRGARRASSRTWDEATSEFEAVLQELEP